MSGIDTTCCSDIDLRKRINSDHLTSDESLQILSPFMQSFYPSIYSRAHRALKDLYSPKELRKMTTTQGEFAAEWKRNN